MNLEGIFLKKLGIILMILIGYISPEMPHKEINELEDLVTIAKDNNLHIEGWMVTLKEKVTTKQAQQHLTVLQKEHIIQETAHKEITKYIINNNDEENGIAVTYELTIPHDQSISPQLAVTIGGHHLSMSVMDTYKEILTSIRNQFFTKESSQFTCLTAIKNGKIASDDFFKKTVENLDLKHISTQVDIINEVPYQETIYGYTPLWDNELIIKNKPLNIQMVIQEFKNEKQQVIIGTPFLITEY